MMDTHSSCRHDWVGSFFQLAKVDNDPVVEALGYDSNFVSFLTASGFSLNQLTAGWIIAAYSEWKKERWLSPETRHALPAVMTEAHPATPALSEPTDITARFFSTHLMILPPIGQHSIDGYADRKVVLAYSGSRHALALQTKDYLEAHHIEALFVELESKTPAEFRSYLESALGGVEDVIGVIVFPHASTAAMIDSPPAYSAQVRDSLGRLLLLFQALTPRLNTLIGKMPLPFCGAVTFNAIKNGNDLDPFHAAICSFWETLKAPLKNHPVIKVIDFDCDKSFSPPTILSELIINDRQGTVAVRNGRRLAPILCPSGNGKDARETVSPLSADSVVLAIGGGTGITARCLESLVLEAGPLDIIMSGRTTPHLSPFWEDIFQESESDRKDDLLRTALSKMKAYGAQIDPGRVHADLDRFLRSREVYGTIEKLRAMGCRVEYRPADVGNGISLRNLIDQILYSHRKIDLLIYSAGVDRSQSFMNKDIESFNTVLHPKVSGAANLLSLTAEVEAIKHIVLFSSAYTWFGFEGSVDYVAGNRFLAALGQYWDLRAKTSKIRAVHWGPWAEVGLAASDRLAEYFKNLGMKAIAPETGAKLFSEFVSYHSGDVTILDVSAQLHHISDMVADSQDVLEANRRLNENKARFPLLDRITSLEPDRCLKAVKRFSLSHDYYLMDHVIDGSPLVPGVFGMELMAEAANFLFPDLVVTTLKEVFFKTPIKCHDDVPSMVEVEAISVNTSGAGKTLHVTVKELIPKSSGGFHLSRDPSYECDIVLGESRAVKKYLEDQKETGLTVEIQTSKILELCASEGYHFGQIMTGQSDTMSFSQGTAVSRFTLSDSRALSYPSPCEFITCPQAFDVGLQCQLRRSILQDDQRQLPYHIPFVKLYDWSKNPGLLSVRVRRLSVDQQGKQVYFSVHVLEEDGRLLAESEVWGYTISQAKTNPWLLLDSDVSQTGKIQDDLTFSIQSPTVEELDTAVVDLPKQWCLGLPENLGREKIHDFIAARQALWNLLSAPEVCPLVPCPGERLNLCKDANGVPYLTDNTGQKIPAHISLSHSNAFGAAAFSCMNQVGIDIESFGAGYPQSLSDGEGLEESEKSRLSELGAQTGYGRTALAVLLFSLKEAVFKCLSSDHRSVKTVNSPRIGFELADISPYGTAQIETNLGLVECRYIILGKTVLSLAYSKRRCLE